METAEARPLRMNLFLKKATSARLARWLEREQARLARVEAPSTTRHALVTRAVVEALERVEATETAA